MNVRAFLPKTWLKLNEIPLSLLVDEEGNPIEEEPSRYVNWIVKPFTHARSNAVKEWLRKNEENDWDSKLTPEARNAELLWQVVSSPPGLTADVILKDFDPPTIEWLVGVVLDFFLLRLLPQGPEVDPEGMLYLNLPRPTSAEPGAGSPSGPDTTSASS